MKGNHITINDFDLFADLVKASTKMLDSAKFQISTAGFEIYGARGNSGRCEISSNSICGDSEFSFCIEKMQMLYRIIQTVREVHKGDYSGVELEYCQGSLNFKSKKFRNKFRTCSPDIIERWVSKKIETKMDTVFRFTTSSDLIKRLNGHAFIFSDSKQARVYVETKPDMENNSVFATLGDRSSSLNNELTLKLGLVTFGQIPDNRNIILDLERFNLLNVVESENIDVHLMNYNVIVCKNRVQGKNDTFFDMNIYISMIKE